MFAFCDIAHHQTNFRDTTYIKHVYKSCTRRQTFIKLFGGTETSYNISTYTYSNPFLYDNANNQLLDKNNNELLSSEITESTGKLKKTIPANIWTDITDIIGSNFSFIIANKNLHIRDNGIPAKAKNWLINEYNDIELPLQTLFKDFALDVSSEDKVNIYNHFFNTRPNYYSVKQYIIDEIDKILGDDNERS